MSKLEKRLDKSIMEMDKYLSLFNSPLAPRGEGARYAAGKEFYDLMMDMVNLAMQDSDIACIKLISYLLSMGCTMIDVDPEVYDYED